MSTSTSAFSTGDDVISRSIECQSKATEVDALTTVYELERCTSWIQDGGYLRVALQFPDQLLVDAPAVAAEFQQHLPEISVFILGDTSYGSCCVDEVGAQHYRADCVIHFGRACLSPSARLPVLYIFGESPIDVQDCVVKITAVLEQDTQMVLVYDTTYSFVSDKIFTGLKSHFKHITSSKLLDPSTTSSTQGNKISLPKSCCKASGVTSSNSSVLKGNSKSSNESDASSKVLSCRENPDSSAPLHGSDTDREAGTFCKCGRVFSLPQGTSIEQHTFLFIGSSESPALLNMMMTFNKCSFYTYDPSTCLCQKESLNVNKALMKRYYLIERAKDANIVGIVAGTLGVARYAEMINHLKKLLKLAGKKSYTFVVGKLNPAKLANFAEVDVYVLVACPESSVLDQSDFYRPVVSPLEMEMACNKARVWTGDYSGDFRELLPGAENFIEAPVPEESEIADVSLISNKIRTLGTQEQPEVVGTNENTVALRTDSTVANVAQNAGEFLTNRSWQGLERKLGETPVVKATEGQCGIAASYNHEPST